MWIAFANFFCKNINIYAIVDAQRFNDTLTNDMVSLTTGPRLSLCTEICDGMANSVDPDQTTP